MILLVVGQCVPRRSILAGEKQRNPASAAPAGAKPARSSAAPEPNESRTKPDYTGRRTAIDRDNRAVEGNACERRQACSLADLRKRASPFGYPRERVFRQAASPLWVCAVKRRRFPVGASPTRQPLQPEATGAVMEVTKWLKPSISVSRIGDSASVQAVTRVNAEQASKRTMRRPTRQPFRGRLIRLGE